MGFFNSSCSFTRFRLVDAVPAELWGQVPEKLKQFAFRDIDDLPEERAFGWTSFEDMLDMEWLSAPPEKGAYIVFSLRLDTRRVPAGVIKKHLALALKDEKAKMAEQGKKFVSRERKKELKEQVVLKLRMRFLPVPAEFNVVWATDTGEIWFASTQNKVVELFTEYFIRTFDLHIEPMTPYSLALSLLPEAAAPALDALEPTTFATERD
jgi:DNA recombination-dependent growth factor C